MSVKKIVPHQPKASPHVTVINAWEEIFAMQVQVAKFADLYTI